MNAPTDLAKLASHEAVAGALTGESAADILRGIQATGGVQVVEAVGRIGPVPIAIAERLVPGGGADAVKAIEAQGEEAVRRVSATAARLRKPLARDNIEKVEAAASGGKAVTRARILESVDSIARAKKIRELALQRLDDPTLTDKVEAVLKMLPPTGDLEADAAAIAKHLAPKDADRFLREIHFLVTDALKWSLKDAIPDKEMQALIEEALEAAKATGAAYAPEFRKRLQALLFDRPAAREAIERVMQMLDGSGMRKLVDAVFDAVVDPQIKLLIDATFTYEGKRRLVAQLGSYVKLYNPVRSAKAREGFIGWLYEATDFVTNLVGEAARQRSAALLTALGHEPGLGVGVLGEALHYDVHAAMLPEFGDKLKQGTDVFATIALSRGGRTVHVVAAGLEAKGVEGVEEGVRQFNDLPRRMRLGTQVRTELGKPFTVGEDLFFSVEDALRKLGADEAAAHRVGQAVGDKSFAGFVVSPRAQAEGAATLKRLGRADLAYRQHPVSRSTMETIADALAGILGPVARRP